MLAKEWSRDWNPGPNLFKTKIFIFSYGGLCWKFELRKLWKVILIVFLYFKYLLLVLWCHMSCVLYFFQEFCKKLFIYFSISAFQLCVTSITEEVEPHSLSHFDHIVILYIPNLVVCGHVSSFSDFFKKFVIWFLLFSLILISTMCNFHHGGGRDA